jgi:hypothetical protein
MTYEPDEELTEDALGLHYTVSAPSWFGLLSAEQRQWVVDNIAPDDEEE